MQYNNCIAGVINSLYSTLNYCYMYATVLAIILPQVYSIEEGGGFKFFQLPSHFALTGLLHHSTTSAVYLVGNEVNLI